MNMVLKWLKGLFIGILCYIFCGVGFAQIGMFAYFMQQADTYHSLETHKWYPIHINANDDICLTVVSPYFDKGKFAQIEINYPKQNIQFKHWNHKGIALFTPAHMNVSNLSQKQTYRLQSASIYQRIDKQGLKHYYITDAVFPKNTLSTDEHTIRLSWRPDEYKQAYLALKPDIFLVGFVLLLSFIVSSYLSWVALASATRYFKQTFYFVFIGPQLLILFLYLIYAIPIK